MDRVKDVSALAADISESRMSLVLARVNGRNVRLRVLQDRTAAGVRHRGRVEGRATMIVIDGFAPGS